MPAAAPDVLLLPDVLVGEVVSTSPVLVVEPSPPEVPVSPVLPACVPADRDEPLHAVGAAAKAAARKEVREVMPPAQFSKQ